MCCCRVYFSKLPPHLNDDILNWPSRDEFLQPEFRRPDKCFAPGSKFSRFSARFTCRVPKVHLYEELRRVMRMKKRVIGRLDLECNDLCLERRPKASKQCEIARETANREDEFLKVERLLF